VFIESPPFSILIIVFANFYNLCITVSADLKFVVWEKSTKRANERGKNDEKQQKRKKGLTKREVSDIINKSLDERSFKK